MIILSIPWNENILGSLKINDNSADFIEFRFDYSKQFTSIPTHPIPKNTIITVRDKNEGGVHYWELPEKIEFYRKMINRYDCLVDLEYNIFTKTKPDIATNNLILSYHNWSEKQDFKILKELITKLNEIDCRYIKLAFPINDYHEFDQVNELIASANKPVLFAGLGRLGKLSRLLYKHLGAEGTYSGIRNHQTSIYQLTQENIERFNLTDMRSDSLLGGLIGGNQVYDSSGLTHFNVLFQQYDLSACYLPLHVEDLENFWSWIRTGCFKNLFYGFSITMPWPKASE